MSTLESDTWEANSLAERGVVLTGRYAHYCGGWDGLCVDETCPEWPCECADYILQADANGEWKKNGGA